MTDLYGFWRSQATFRVRVALNLKGIAYREIPVDIDRGAQDADAFRRISPMGSVPALVADGATLIQSVAILEYLEESHPSPALMPSDAAGRARVRSLVAMAVSDTHPLIVPRIKKYLAEHAGFDAAAWKAWQTNWFSAGLRGLEARLANEPQTGAFCHGEEPTLADICLVGVHAGIRTLGIDVERIPTVERIVDRCWALKPFDDARAEKQSDFPG